MKILIIIGSFKIGGAERMSVQVGTELIKRGYDVHYIIQRPIFEIPHTIPSEKITILRKVNRSDTWYKGKSLFLGTFRTARRIKPDVVIGFSRFSSFLSIFTFCSNIIGTFDAYPFRLSKKQQFYARTVLKSSLIKAVVLPSLGMHKAVSKSHPFYLEKYVLIPNALNQEELIQKSQKKVNGYEFKYISAMGRLSPQKNFELLIKAYSRSKVRNELKLVIIGDGYHRSALEDLVEELGLSQHVVFTGGLSNPFPVIADSEFFVNPSLYESFCVAILEALVLSKAVIAHDCDYGPSDMIETGKNGFLIENNVDELVEKIDLLWQNEKLRRKFESEAKASVNKFSINNIGDLWEKLIQRVVNSKERSNECLVEMFYSSKND